MFVGPGVIITGVDIEHGANASSGQQSPVRLHLRLTLVSLVGKCHPAQRDSGMRGKKKRRDHGLCTIGAKRGAFYIEGITTTNQDNIMAPCVFAAIIIRSCQ